MFDSVAQAMPRSASTSSAVTLLVKCVQPGHSASGPRSMNWYTISWPLSPNRSRRVTPPDVAVKVYAPNATIGKRRRRAASATWVRVASFSAISNSSRAC